MVEKSELVELARRAGEAGAANAAPGGVPGGYLYHADSGYYWGEADSMYFEAASGCYYSPVTREWFRRDPASGDFVPVKAGEAQGL